MDKIRISQVIAVEGRYDAHAVRACFDTQVIELGGFGIYKNAELRKVLKKYAEVCGLVLLTDSDSAGFMIRARVAEAVQPHSVINAYVPDIRGKERRKRAPGAEGLLGVEGMSREIITNAVLAAIGNSAPDAPPRPEITRTMLYEDGFFGGQNSAALRARLTRRLNLPARISVSGLIGAINRLSSPDEYQSIAQEIKTEVSEK